MNSWSEVIQNILFLASRSFFIFEFSFGKSWFNLKLGWKEIEEDGSQKLSIRYNKFKLNFEN